MFILFLPPNHTHMETKYVQYVISFVEFTTTDTKHINEKTRAIMVNINKSFRTNRSRTFALLNNKIKRLNPAIAILVFTPGKNENSNGKR